MEQFISSICIWSCIWSFWETCESLNIVFFRNFMTKLPTDQSHGPQKAVLHISVTNYLHVWCFCVFFSSFHPSLPGPAQGFFLLKCFIFFLTVISWARLHVSGRGLTAILIVRCCVNKGTVNRSRWRHLPSHNLILKKKITITRGTALSTCSIHNAQWVLLSPY